MTPARSPRFERVFECAATRGVSSRLQRSAWVDGVTAPHLTASPDSYRVAVRGTKDGRASSSPKPDDGRLLKTKSGTAEAVSDCCARSSGRTHASAFLSVVAYDNDGRPLRPRISAENGLKKKSELIDVSNDLAFRGSSPNFRAKSLAAPDPRCTRPSLHPTLAAPGRAALSPSRSCVRDLHPFARDRLPEASFAYG